jgi:mannose-6-phosphate isomerase-like protein (cupin superfamily)
MTEKEFETNWAERGFSFGVGNIKFDGGVADAVHDDQDELVVMANGRLEFTIDNKIYIPEKNTEVFIPAKSRHSIKNIGTEESKIYYGYKSTNK